jgi:phosphate transport system substrate-binding protein
VSVNWPIGTAVMGNEGIAGLVKKTPGALAYVPLTYALRGDLQTALVKNRESATVKAGAEAVTAAATAALAANGDDFSAALADAPGKDSYPICGTTWAVIFAKQPPDKGRALAAFFRWATHEGQGCAVELEYARLPGGLVEHLDKELAKVARGKP